MGRNGMTLKLKPRSLVVTVCALTVGLAVEKVYWAVVENYSRPESEGKIDAMVTSEETGQAFQCPCSH